MPQSNSLQRIRRLLSGIRRERFLHALNGCVSRASPIARSVKSHVNSRGRRVSRGELLADPGKPLA